jgi:hypothetical protein
MTMASCRIDPTYSYTDASACDDASDTETSAPITGVALLLGPWDAQGLPDLAEISFTGPSRVFRAACLPLSPDSNHQQLQHHATNLFIVVWVQHVCLQLPSVGMTRQYDAPRRSLILDHRLGAIAPPMLS